MTKKRKVILFTSLPKVGGHTTLTLGLCKLFTQWFDEVEVWCKTMPEHGHSADALSVLESMGCRVERISDLQGKINVGVLGAALLRAWRHPPTLFFVLAMRRLSVVLCKMLPGANSIYYHITHDLNANTRAALDLYRRVFRRLVFICPATYKEFAGPETQCAWAAQSSEIPGIDRETLHRERVAGIAESPNRVCFGLLGRLTREKGAEEVIKFIESCDQPCEFHIAGSGPYAEQFLALSQRSEAHAAVVKFYGTYEPTQRAAFFTRFFSRIDWLMVPSIDEWETLSMVTLEAIQYGVPVLCSHAGGLKSFAMEELGPAPPGVIDLFAPSDLDAQLRARIRAGKSDPAAVDRCRQHYDQFFADHVVSKRWSELTGV